MKYKVSIIIPAYNAEKYLKEAIDSAINQTYKNIEVIVVNDGSKDNTEKIAKSYGDKIKYLKKENGGVSTALNLGIKNMTGDYFSWLSHDDRYYPEKIEKQIDYLSNLEKIDNVILYSDYDLMNKKSKIYDKSIKNHKELTKKPEYALLRGEINGITLLIPKEAFEKCGMFNEKLRCVQDYELWKKMQGEYKFIHQPEILATTRIHNKQQGNNNPKKLEEGNDFWIDLIKDIPKEKKEQLEGTEYNFYCEMLKFLKTTPYDKTAKFVENKICNIEEEAKNKIKNIKVSVIIPFYNRINSVCNAIDSVTNQTHENTEIVLIDDGSTENKKLLTDKISSLKNVKMIELEKNSGPANARNIGIGNATGEYIAFLDSDDLFRQNKIEKQLLNMYLTGSLFSHTSYLRKGFGQDTFMNTGEMYNGKVVPKIIAECGIATPTIMVEKKLFSDTEFKYDDNLRIGEDVCLYLKVLENIFVLGINEDLTIVNTGENTAAYNLDKQLEGLNSIISFVTSKESLAKYYKEIAVLLKTYISISEKKELKDDGIDIEIRSIKGYLQTYKKDKALFKKLIKYKLKGHPKMLKLLRFLKIFKRN